MNVVATKIPSKDSMYFFIGSEFSDRVPQNVKLHQAYRRFQRVVRLLVSDALLFTTPSKRKRSYNNHRHCDGRPSDSESNGVSNVFDHFIFRFITAGNKSRHAVKHDG